jgi:N-acetylmuramoyl-L-alanine amidase
MAVTGVNGAKSATETKTSTNARPSEITVKSGETLTTIAKKFGMTVKEFQAWTGLKSASLNAGQKISLPTDIVPAHKGLKALADKYGMTLGEFCKLNGISKDYKPSKGEYFYVKNLTSSINSGKTNEVKSNNAKSNATVTNNNTANTATKTVAKTATNTVINTAPATENKTTEAKSVKSNTSGNAVVYNQSKYGSVYSPEELGKSIYKKSGEYYGAVGKPDFDALLKEINPKNVQAVIENYEGLKDNESLINTLTSEVMSSKDVRKAAVMKIYDTVAKAKGANPATRQVFETELKAQFNAFGMVDTKKLDAIIDELLKLPDATNYNTRVQLENGKTFKAGDLQESAIKSSKKSIEDDFRKYCIEHNMKYDSSMLNLKSVESFPLPIVGKDGKITTKETEVLKPTGKPNGKVVILNPGHGGYSVKNGYFDVGAYSFMKNQKTGKYEPMFEYERMKAYADDTAAKLRAQGYSVVLMGSHIDTIKNEQAVTNVIEELKQGSKDGVKYNESDIMFISMHADSGSTKSGTSICYDDTANGVKLTEIMAKSLETSNQLSSVEKSERKWGTNGLLVLHQAGNIPAILLETEFINGTESEKLRDKAFQMSLENKLVGGVNKYFGIKDNRS